jgi:hypothetical protein
MPQNKMTIKKYADDKHQKQAEQFIFAVGNFVIEFERVCDTIRYIIMFALRSQGLKNQGMEQVIIGDKASAELQLLLGALFCELPSQDSDDEKEVRKLLKDIKDLTTVRNVLLHSNWNLGTKACPDELIAATVRYRTKQTKGSSAEVQGFSASYVDKLSSEARRIQILLQRLEYCICQSGFKVATELKKIV